MCTRARLTATDKITVEILQAYPLKLGEDVEIVTILENRGVREIYNMLIEGSIYIDEDLQRGYV